MTVKQTVEPLITPTARPLWTNHGKRIVYCIGGRAGGKTIAVAERIIGHMLEEPGVRIMCCRAEKESLSGSVKPEIEDSIRRMGVRSAFQDFMRSEIRANNGSVIHFKGLQHSPDSIKGFSAYKYFFIDEGNQITRLQWERFIPTPRKPGHRVYICINPTRAIDPVYADFMVPNDETGLVRFDDVLRLEFSWKDLRNLRDSDGEWLLDRSLLSQIENDYRVIPLEAEHLWGGGLAHRQDTLVFQHGQNWNIGSTDEKLCVYGVQRVKKPYYARTYYGIDFAGGAHTPGAVIRCSHWDNRIHIEAESIKKGANDVDMRKMIAEVINGPNALFLSDHNCRLSSNRARGWGYDVKFAVKGPDSVMAGVTWLKSNKITIEPTCKKTIEQFGLWAYKIGSDGLVIVPEKPLPVDKDTIDALRYALSEKITGRRASYGTHSLGAVKRSSAVLPDVSPVDALKRRLVG